MLAYMDGSKEVYLVNTVDEMTQFQRSCAVEKIQRTVSGAGAEGDAGGISVHHSGIPQ